MKRGWLLLLVMVCLIGTAGVVFGSRTWIRSTYQKGMEAYQARDVSTAVKHFAQVGRFPLFLGNGVSLARERTKELETFRSAQQLWEQGTDYEAAALALKNFLTAYPQSAFAEIASAEWAEYEAYQKATSLRQERDYEKALEACQAYLEKYPKGVLVENCQEAMEQIPFEWAEHLAAKQDYQQAVAVITDFGAKAGLPTALREKAGEKRLQLLMDWAAFEFEAKNYARAEALYLQIGQEFDAEPASNLAQVYFAWAEQLLGQGDPEGAAAKYRLAAALKGLPQDALNQAKARRDQTLLEWGAALLESGETLEAGRVFALLIAEGQEEAVRRIPPEAVEPLISFGEAQLAQGEAGSAHQVFSYLTAQTLPSPQLATRSLVGLGRALHIKREYFRAVTAFQQALEGAKNPAEIAMIKAELDRAYFGLSQLPLQEKPGQALVAIFASMVVDEKRLSFDKERCHEGVCFSPEELRAAHQAIGREADASMFYHYDGPDFLPRDQEAVRLGHLRYVVKTSTDVVNIQTCRYGPPGTGAVTNLLIRQRRRVIVEIYDLVSGRMVATQSVSGSDPEPCPARRGFGTGTEYLIGWDPEPEAVFAVYRRYQKTMVFNRSLLEDDFSGNGNRWPLGEDPAGRWRGSWELTKGVLQASGTADQAFYAMVYPATLQSPLTHLQAEVTVKAQGEGFYGLALRASNRQFYAFVINEERAAFALLLWTGEEWRTLIPWTPVEALKRSKGGTHTLSVRSVGKHFWLSLDGVPIGAVEDATLPSGFVGVVVGSEMSAEALTVQFDQFEVKVP